MHKGTPTKVLFLRDLCLRPAGLSCRRCVESCPKGAIAFGNNNAAIDARACSSCGICVGECDAFALPQMSLESLISQARQIALAGSDIILTCTYVLPAGFEPAENVLALPCLAMLPWQFFTALLAEGAKLSVAAAFDACEECPRTGARGLDIFSEAIEKAERATACSVAFSDEVPERQVESGLLQSLADASTMERRDAFDSIVGQVGDIASGNYRLRKNEELRRATEQAERLAQRERIGGTSGAPEANGFVEEGVTRSLLMPRQRMLLEAVDACEQVAQGVEVMISATDLSLCDNARSCCSVCPTGARTPDPIWGELRFEPRLCIGCGLCESACTRQAVSLRTALAGELLHEAL